MNTEAYNKGREQNLSQKYNLDNYDHERRRFDGGYESPLGAAFVDAYPQYKEVNGYSETPEFSDFVKGYNSVYWEEQAAKRKDYKLDEFLSELDTLRKKYSVSIKTNNDYDPGYGVIKDFQFDIDIKCDKE